MSLDILLSNYNIIFLVWCMQESEIQHDILQNIFKAYLLEAEIKSLWT